MKRIILSGGGTGGHIYPAVAVAEALKRRLGDEVELLFVGAEGKMEMEKVPEAGYKIVGLPVRGLQRKLTLNNLKVLWNLWRSLKKGVFSSSPSSPHATKSDAVMAIATVIHTNLFMIKLI